MSMSIYRVFVVLVVDLVAFTAILPLLPAILDYYEKVEQESENKKDSALVLLHTVMDKIKQLLNMPNTRKYNNVLVGGILGSLFSLLQFFSNPFFGAFSDVYGRKTVLLLSTLGTALSYFVWLKADTFTLFVWSRIIGGISKGSVTVCTAMMSDLTSKENRAKGMALIGIAFSLGFTIGPLVGAYFALQSPKDTKLPFFDPARFSLSLQLIDVLLVIWAIKETVPKTEKVLLRDRLSTACQLANPISLLKSVCGKSSSKKMWIIEQLTLTHFVYLLLFSGLEFTLTFLTHQRFNFTSREQGMLFLYIGLVMILVQGGYVRRAKHGREKQIALRGILSIIPAMVIVAFSSSTYAIHLGLFFYSFGAATVVPCLTTLFSQEAGSEGTGELLGIFRALGALARAFGPFIVCAVYWIVGSTVCYLIGGLLFVFPVLMLDRIQKEKPQEKED